MLCLAISTAFSLMTFSANGQQSTLEFPEQLVHLKTDDTTAILRMIRLHTKLRNSDRALGENILWTALANSRRIKFNRGIYLALNRLALEIHSRGNADSSLKLMAEASKYADLPENVNNVHIFYNNIGISYSAMGKYQQALYSYNKALEALTKYKLKPNGTDSVGIYNNIAILWARLEENDYALRTFRIAEAIANKNHDSVQAVSSRRNIAEMHTIMGDLEKAEACYKDILASSSQPAYAEFKPAALCGLGVIAIEKGAYEKALDFLMASLNLAIKEKEPAYIIVGTRASIGEAYLGMKQYAKAIAILQAAYNDANSMQHSELIGRIEPKLSEALAASGNYMVAYQMLKHHSVLRDSVVKKEKARALDALMNVIMTEKNKAMAEQELRIAKQKNELQYKNYFIIVTVLAAAIVVLVSFSVSRSNRHRQAMQQALIGQLQQKNEIDELKAQVRGEEQERERIARELHDNIASQLWAIKLNMEAIGESDKTAIEYDQKMALVFKQMSDATQDVRRTAHNLMPDLLLEDGLTTALASLCERIRINTRLDVDFLEYGVVPPIDKDIELSIYRMVQELTQNVLKHAIGATHLLVQISCAEMLLNITIEDNGGAGDKPKEGVGLQQIRKRVQALKGHFDLQSTPGKGTTVYLEFDLQHLL